MHYLSVEVKWSQRKIAEHFKQTGHKKSKSQMFVTEEQFESGSEELRILGATNRKLACSTSTTWGSGESLTIRNNSVPIYIDRYGHTKTIQLKTSCDQELTMDLIEQIAKEIAPHLNPLLVKDLPENIKA